MKRSSSRLIGDVIGEYIAEDHLEDGLLRARIFEAWDLVVGNPALTSRKYFKDGVLTCRITSSVARTQLRYNVESLKNQLNSLLQGSYVEKIVLS